MKPVPPSVSSTQGGEGHFGIERLRAFRAHRLSSEEEARIAEHLLTCLECRELAADVSAFFDPPEEGEEPPRVDPKATWEGVRAALTVDGWFAQRRVRQRRRAMRSVLITAACLVLAVLGLSRSRMVGAEEHILNSVAGHKGPQAGQEETERVWLPAILKLNLDAVESSSAYRADLVDEAGYEAGLFRRLRPDEEGRLELHLRRWSLPPGVYRLAVRPESARAESPAVEYRFRVVSR